MASEDQDTLRTLVHGGLAGALARTAVAPLDRLKIVYQVEAQASVPGIWRELAQEARGRPQLWWRGNSATVLKVFPLLGIQYAANSYFQPFFDGVAGAAFWAGSAATLLSVGLTYPLDILRGRLAINRGAQSSMGEVFSQLAREGQGFRGAGLAFKAAFFYGGVKFYVYDGSKHMLGDFLNPHACHLLSGALAGVASLTTMYPTDVLRRRVQGSRDAETWQKYGKIVGGVSRLYREEGLRHGVFRGYPVLLLPLLCLNTFKKLGDPLCLVWSQWFITPWKEADTRDPVRVPVPVVDAGANGRSFASMTLTCAGSVSGRTP